MANTVDRPCPQILKTFYSRSLRLEQLDSVLEDIRRECDDMGMLNTGIGIGRYNEPSQSLSVGAFLLALRMVVDAEQAKLPREKEWTAEDEAEAEAEAERKEYDAANE
jgi:hypothetical protein